MQKKCNAIRMIYSTYDPNNNAGKLYDKNYFRSQTLPDKINICIPTIPLGNNVLVPQNNQTLKDS